MTSEAFDGDSTDAQGGRIRIRRIGRGKPCLIMIAGAFPGETYVLEPGSELTIGRAPGNDIRLCYTDVSRVQARVKVSGSGKVEMIDLGSTNGTFVNGRRQLYRALREGDKIQFGEKSVFRFAFYDELDQEFQQRLFGCPVLDKETSTLSRQRLETLLPGAFSANQEADRDLCVIAMTVDGFELLVDLLGYAVRDYFLRELSWVIRRSVAGEAALFRLGPKAFAALLEGVSPEQATELAERMRRAVARARLTYRGDVMQFSLALGLAALRADRPSGPEDLLRMAEERCRLAESAGGDRIQAAFGADAS